MGKLRPRVSVDPSAASPAGERSLRQRPLLSRRPNNAPSSSVEDVRMLINDCWRTSLLTLWS